MSLEAVLLLVGYLALIGIALWFIGWMLTQIFEDWISIRDQRDLFNDIRDALISKEIDWEGVKIIAASRVVEGNKLTRVLRKLYRESITGRDQELASKSAVLSGLIQQRNKEEPFEGLPSDIRVNLERVRDHISEDVALLEPTADQIKQLIDIEKVARRRDRVVAVFSLIVGVLGLSFAAYPHISGALVSEPAPIQSNESEASSDAR